MKSFGKTILKYRTMKGFTQEELSERAKVNLKTIQRIERGVNEPRDTTLKLVCEALQIEWDDFVEQVESRDPNYLIKRFVSLCFLIVMNLGIISIMAYLTIYDTANFNSRLIAIFPTILIPLIVINRLKNQSDYERFLRFGFGYISFVVFALFQINIEKAIFSGAIPYSIISLCIIYYGSSIKNNSHS